MMAYTLTSNDIGDWKDEIPSKNTAAANSQNVNQSLLNTVANSPLVNFTLGAGDSLRNTITDVANLAPGVNIPLSQTGNGLAYNIGKFAGNTGAFLGGGELLDAARAGSEALPYIGKLAETLGFSSLPNAMARRAIGTAIYGGVTNPNSLTSGAAEGGLTSIVGDAVPYAAEGINSAMQYFRPSAYMNQIIQNLGGGQNLEDATKSVLSSIKSAYESQKGKANELYNPIFSSVSDSPIYNEVRKPNPLMSLDPQAGYTGFYKPISTKFDTVSQEPGQYTSLSPKVFENYSSDLKDLHDTFIKNPTFDNAHALQSQLGIEQSALSGGSSAPDISTLNAISSLGKARTSIKNDIASFLMNTDPKLSQQYLDAADFFKNNVAPYRADPRVYSIATGDTTNMKPVSLGNLFAAPGENLQTISSHLPDDAINNLIYTKLGQRVPKMNPDAFMRNYNSLDQQGLSSYISPEIKEQIANLQNRMNAKNALQFGASGALAGSLGSHGGVGSGIGAALLGSAIGRPVLNYLQTRLPLDQLSESLGNVARGTFPYAKATIIPNLINGGNS